MEIYVNEKDTYNAASTANTFADKAVKNRIYYNCLGNELVTRLLVSEGINVNGINNIHSIKKILEEIDISDIMLPNIHIDVRVIFNEEEIFIPKSHFTYNLLPDIYIVLKAEKDMSYAEVLGFFEPKIINKNNTNKDYYFLEKEKLNSPFDLISFIKNFKGNTYHNLSDSELESYEQSIIALSDNDISEHDKKQLFEQLTKSNDLRSKFIEYENFEILSYKAMRDSFILKPEIAENYEENSTENIEDSALIDESLEVIDENVIDSEPEERLVELNEITEEPFIDVNSEDYKDSENTDVISDVEPFDIGEKLDSVNDEPMTINDVMLNENVDLDNQDIEEEIIPAIENVDEISENISEEKDSETDVLPDNIPSIGELINAETTSEDIVNNEELDNTSLNNTIEELDSIPSFENIANEEELASIPSFDNVVGEEELETVPAIDDIVNDEEPVSSNIINDEDTALSVEDIVSDKSNSSSFGNSLLENLQDEDNNFIDIPETNNEEENVNTAYPSDYTLDALLDSSDDTPEVIKTQENIPSISTVISEIISDDLSNENPDDSHQDIDVLYNEENNELEMPEDIPGGAFVRRDKNDKKRLLITTALITTLIAFSVAYFMKSKNDNVAEVPQNITNEETSDENILDINTPEATVPIKPAKQTSTTNELKNTAKNITPQNSLAYMSVNKLVWDIPENLSYSKNMQTYLKNAGKSIKLSLSTDLLLATEYAYTNNVKVSITLNGSGNLGNIQMISGSGSTQIDNIVLQSIKDVLNVIKPPMQELKGNNTKLTLIIYF